MDFAVICLITMSAIVSIKFCHKLLPQIVASNNRLVRKLLAITPYRVIGHRLGARQLSSSDETGDADNRTKPRLYTRTGDNGSSGLFGSGERRPKDDHIFEALGTTDELSSCIGLAREFVSNKRVDEQLEQIQCILQELQSSIATPKTTSNPSLIEKTRWNRNYLIDLELYIDHHSQTLPPLKNFILPSGGKASAALHLSRAICRRAERRLVPLLDEGLELPVLQYLNRLSSYLFTIARVCALDDRKSETIYKRPKNDSESDS